MAWKVARKLKVAGVIVFQCDQCKAKVRIPVQDAITDKLPPCPWCKERLEQTDAK